MQWYVLLEPMGTPCTSVLSTDTEGAMVIRPENDSVTCQAIRNWTIIYFTEHNVRELQVCSPKVTTATEPEVNMLFNIFLPDWKTWIRILEG